MKSIVLVVSMTCSVCFSMGAWGQDAVLSNSEIEGMLNESVAYKLPTSSIFDAKRCRLYSEIILDQIRDSVGFKSEEATMFSNHLDIWSNKVKQLEAKAGSNSISDELVFLYSGLGLITNTPEGASANIKAATMELFSAESNRCAEMVSDIALTINDNLNDGAEK